MEQIPGTRAGTWMDETGTVWTDHPMHPGAERVMRKVPVGLDVAGREVVGLVRLDGSRMRTSLKALREWMGLGGNYHLQSGTYVLTERGLGWKHK